MSLGHVLAYIELAVTKQTHKIVIFSGAGVSTNAGIPDYRSGNRILLDFLTEDMTSEEFYSDARFSEMVQIFDQASPTPSHMLAKELHD